MESRIIKTEKTAFKKKLIRFYRTLFIILTAGFLHVFNFKIPDLIPNDVSDHIKHKWLTQHL